VTPIDAPMPGWLESAWLARYLDRQLSDQELAWFEAYLLDKPELLAMVEADSGLRDALAADSASEHPAVSSPDPVAPMSGRMRTARMRASIAVAAAITVGIGIGWAGRNAFTSNPNPLDLIANPTRVVYDTMRGAPSNASVERADAQSAYVLVEVAVPPDASKVTLDVVGEPSLPMSPSPDGFVSFLIPRSAFASSMNVSLHYTSGGADSIRKIQFFDLQRR